MRKRVRRVSSVFLTLVVLAPLGSFYIRTGRESAGWQSTAYTNRTRS
jgi:hypothetical protein